MNISNKNIIIIIILLTVCYLFYNNQTVEGFNGVKYCGECGYRTRRKCGSCLDCGFCISQYGDGECVPGDENGPYFRDDCAVWEYGMPYNPLPYPDFYNVLRYPWGWWYNGAWNQYSNYRNNRRRKRKRNKTNKYNKIDKTPIIENDSINWPKKRYRWTISDSGARTRIFPKRITKK